MESAEAAPCPVTLVTGFLGAGKSRLVRRLCAGGIAEARFDDWAGLHAGLRTFPHGGLPEPAPAPLVVELSAAADPVRAAHAVACAPGMRLAGLIAVVDAAMLGRILVDPAIAPLAMHQLRAASRIVLSRCGGDPGKTAHAIARISPAPVIAMDEADPFELLTPHEVRPGPAGPPPPFETWAWSRPAPVDRAALERMLAAPPPGLWRLTGEVRLAAGGLAVDLTGGATDLRPRARVERGRIAAVGIAPAFRRAAMDAAWAEVTG